MKPERIPRAVLKDDRYIHLGCIGCGSIYHWVYDRAHCSEWRRKQSHRAKAQGGQLQGGSVKGGD